MKAARIKEIQEETGYPNSVSVQQALLKVWNECEQATRQEGGEGYVEVKCSDELPTEEGPYYVKMKAINQGMAHPVIFGRHDIYIWDDRPETAEIWVNSFESWLKKATIPKISEGRLEQIVDILVEHIAPTEQEIEFVNDEGFFLYNKRILEIATQLMKGGEG